MTTATTAPVSLVGRARTALDECDGDLAAAVALFRQWCDEEPELRDAIMGDALTRLVTNVFRTAYHHDRAAIRATGRPSVSRQEGGPYEPHGAAAVMEAGAALILQRWQVVGTNRNAARATHADWTNSLSYARKREDAYGFHRHLAEAVLEILPKGQFTEEALTNEAFLELVEEAKRRTAGR